MKNKYAIYILFFLLFSSVSFFSQTVTIDIEQQRFLGDVSNLDRIKYFNMHNSGPDAESEQFLKEHNVGFGRGFWGPFASKGLGNFPSTSPSNDGFVRQVRRFIATASPLNVWKPGYSTGVAGNVAVRYFMDEVSAKDRPEYWEPFNEPFIKAGKTEYTSLGYTQSQVVSEMSVWFREMAKKIHSTPELAKMKVIGFSDAYPSFERRGFTNWRDRQKKFIDIAGTDMDALSVHPYDGVNVTGQANGRSGSNLEAILDLLETYSALKFGAPKKLAISEFGVIENGDIYSAGYNDSEIALTIRGLNSMMFNFFERQDNIEITIPFITGKAEFYYKTPQTKPYIPSLVIPTELRTTVNPNNGLYISDNFKLSWKQNFYKFWKNVEGERATINSDDLDIQAQVFVKGDKAYVVLNNLDDADKNVNLSFLSGGSNISSVLTKSIIVNGILDPFYNPGSVSSSVPSSILLKNGETILFEITYNSNLTFTKTITREKYYGNPSDVSLTSEFAPVLKATASTSHAFNFSRIDKGTLNDGKATLRVSVGVPLKQEFASGLEGLNILPDEIKVNGTALTVPTNWKGYDQTGRVEFFGLLEINVPYNLLNYGNNTVSIKYNKTKGNSNISLGNNRYEKANVTIASVVLSVESKSSDLCTPIKLYADTDGDGLGDPNSFINQCPPVAGYVENADDKCVDDLENSCANLIPGVIQAETYTNGTSSGVQLTNNDTFVGYIQNGDSTEYEVEVEDDGVYNLRFLAAADNDAGGNITITSNNIEVGTVTVTGTGGFKITQAFDASVSLSKGTQTLKLEFSGAGNGGGYLFDLDYFVGTLKTLGVEDYSLKNNLKVLSNPVSNYLRFSSDLADGLDYKIYQINGKFVKKGAYNSQINVSDLTTGLYLIKVENTVLKFIKK
ncbi:carbohydrate-binding protein [Polaribacter sp. SA4-12]|uniref:carbohydrate-binding protein n=1 Tax=Polaribacter sp. SA4-12 TaxID=1312072 RepID=UPI000B3BE171|nr:carbohydrate-binding protein [Polaribacter sp. SA4-12]ARV16524.1 hypothetical protein BTO07_15880 [Polaribacter sp. SA4-12]